MLIGSHFTDPTFGRCEVIGNTPMMVTFRDSTGRRHFRKKPDAKKWRAGARCVVVPDSELPNDSCGGVVLDMNGPKPGRIRLTDHPVWDGAIVHSREVYRIEAVDIPA